MTEREESSKPTEHKRIHLYIPKNRYNRLEEISEDQDLTPAEVVNRFMALGFIDLRN